MRIGFIGAGKVGFSLGKYLAVNGVEISGYFSRSRSSAEEAAGFTGSAVFDDPGTLAAQSDTIFITVPDGAISSVFDQLRDHSLSGKTICHCSGAMTADEAFGDLSAYGAYGCSIHPLFPVSSRYDSYKELKSAFFCMEGSSAVINDWKELFSGFGNPVRIISGDTKREYHAACAISSNLVCALVAESTELMNKCGFSGEEALAALEPLAMANIKKIFSAGPVDALTGPVERCDISTVKKHLACLPEGSGKEMYRAVSLRLTDTAARKHPDTDYSEMRALLGKK
ncbi:MAG: DUF2520 domain-containing protein [Ruminococcus sp.]|nr:DUF2520 domain-containing protein [Ruminococcus sp.]